MSTVNTKDGSGDPVDIERVLDRIAHYLGQLSRERATGPLAELRRLNVDRPTAPPFHQLLAQCVPVALFRDWRGEGDEMDLMRRLAQIVQVMALRPDGLQRYNLGETLQSARVSPSRVGMFLSARGAMLSDLSRRLARRLALAPNPLPYNEIGRLLLYEGRPDYFAEADQIRLRIASDFARAARQRKDDRATNDE